ncbi:hypothetical protein RQM47_03800 [Rubrivirga sp. S365]|uniref:hypothetical protein n=1 Tax=Rubrivirga sp. S365 TaxID=3076080 RepID=UPI0028C7D6DA|nr:hypothetical protein [Rubrivirga sp. S365]MDT7855758.1 hypothetical protein [Rubrivirga sp. S365]
MPFNLLLLPALGGYLSLRFWNRTRFFLARQDGYRFVLWVALAATALLAVATLLVAALYATGAGRSAATVWHRAVPFVHSGKAVAALGLGAIAPLLLNSVPQVVGLRFDGWNNERYWARRALDVAGDELELLLFRSLEHKMLVMATLSSGKVYVGFVTRSLPPDVERRYLRVLPVASGYRDEDDQQVEFTTLYEEVRQQAENVESPLYGLLDQDFEIVIPVRELVTVNLFDFVAYEAFNADAA